MAQPQGYNQFSNYNMVPGQGGGQGQGFGPQRQRSSSDLNQTPPTGDPGRPQSQYPSGTFQQGPQSYPWQQMMQRNQSQSTATQSAPQQAGAAGQAAPDTQQQTYAPQTQRPPHMPAMQQQPSGHMEMGDYNAPGAWSNGYNPHMVYDQPAAMAMPQRPAQSQYPAGTFQVGGPATSPVMPRPPASTPAASPAAPALTNGIPTWMLGQAASAAAAPQGPDPMSGEGWKNGVSPQGFQAANPYYGQTGYYGDLGQVQAQMAGGAQSAGIPQGVLGASAYTQNPATATPWQPAATPQQLVSQDLSNWEANRWNPK